MSQFIEPALLYNHYKSLNSKIVKADDCINSVEAPQVFNELDFRITLEEITLAVKGLKSSKAPGIDAVSNDMIKCGFTILAPLLVKTFNLVLSAGHFPAEWAKGRIVSLHKKGDVLDPSNYRGITISSCVGKLFNSILNNRLSNFLNVNGILCDEQIGFRKGHRPADHMLIVKSLIEKYKKQRKKLFLCFIDFKKAYDSVWHAGLLHKLRGIGLSQKFFSVIKSMYQQSTLTVQIGDKLTPFFRSLIGVKQGDNLSPTLFNIFINDIPKLFDEACNPVTFGDLSIACLLYADDLVLFSESKQGLQRGLDKISHYCNEWALEVNAAKTKVMVINCDDDPECLFGDTKLECVSIFKYLGIEFSNKGDISVALKDLSKRGLKASFGLTRSLRDAQVNPTTQLHLFDHLIKPILLYGSEILGVVNISDRRTSTAKSDAGAFFQNLKNEFPIISKFVDRDDPLEKVHLKFCKNILGVHAKASNIAAYGELGRYPIFLDQIVACVKYYLHVEYTESNKILKNFYSKMGKEVNVLKASGFAFAEKVLEILNIPKPSNQQGLRICAKSVKSALQHRYTLYWQSLKNTTYSKSSKGNNKLRTYSTFKVSFGPESYLRIRKPELRRAIARLRMSAHRLNIETGRFNGKNKYIPPEERVCTQCQMDAVEDELHFLIECPKYDQCRDSLFSRVGGMNKYFSMYDSTQKFLWLLTNENLEALEVTAAFIVGAFELRGK